MTNTMMSVREKIYWAIKPWHGKKYARIYDIVMLIAIAVGILPLMFRYHYEAFWYLNLLVKIKNSTFARKIGNK